jgi:hypothetical protein
MLMGAGNQHCLLTLLCFAVAGLPAGCAGAAGGDVVAWDLLMNTGHVL